MKIAAVGVTTSDLNQTVKFYELLGFKFPEYKPDEDHLEPENVPGSARLMIDTKQLVTEILGEEPRRGNHSAFAIEYDSAAEVNEIAEKVRSAGFKVVKEPWDAFWGQRYAIVADPDGYMIDLYATL
jgi:catechol 2,3-dioxygenase-like lactoylglutathione lyase family enzyme